jgi:hypothetical protein
MIAAGAALAVVLIDKNSSAPTGVPPRTVADYIRAVVMAHRHFYTIHVVNRLRKEHIVDAAEDWRATHSLPLPVQLIRETSEIAELTGPNVRYHLASEWPINKANAPANEFERQGLKAVEISPNKPYYGTIESEGKQLFGAVYADIAVTAVCVECHNAHPKSKKSDFKVGDIMGALVITFPLSNQ